jgi:hypothetical protein
MERAPTRTATRWTKRAALVPMNVRRVSLFAACVALSAVTAACFSQSTISPQVTVENIRQVKIGMSRPEVEHLLGSPLAVDQQDPKFNGAGAELMVYSSRLPMPMQYPMLWVHLRDGKVESVYAKRHHIADSWGVYWITKERQWEAPDFVKTFPATSHETKR